MERSSLSTTQILIRTGPAIVSAYQVDLPGAGAVHVELPYPLRVEQAFEAVGQLRELASVLESNFHLLDHEPSSQRDDLLRACERFRSSEHNEVSLDLKGARARLADYGLFRDAVAEYLRLLTIGWL